MVKMVEALPAEDWLNPETEPKMWDLDDAEVLDENWKGVLLECR